MIRTLVIGVATLVLTQPAAAQQPAPPTCSSVEHRQFDFWAGDWVVTDSGGGTVYGTNSITVTEAGCILHEHWAGIRGASGQSFNFYDRTAGRWSQVWVASNGNVLRLEGQLDGAAMRLEGDSRTPQGAVKNRITWTPQADGRVRQTWSISRDGGATWQAGFDGWYRRKPS